jgi:hypothetical protein
MTQYEALHMLQAAGYTVKASGKDWHVAAPVGSRGEELQPGGAVLSEWVMIALAKAVALRMTPQEKMVASSRWN